MLNDEYINAIVCNFRDITERVLQENEINRKAAQIEEILERITDGFIALDDQFRYIYANKRIGLMLGTQPDVLLGKNVWDLFPDAVGSKTYHAFLYAFQNQQYVNAEDYYAPLNLWQENFIYPSPEGLSVFIRDISVQKATEEKINQQHLRLKEAAETQTAILDALPPQIALLNQEGLILNVNESWRKFANENDLHEANYGVGRNYIDICDATNGADRAASRQIAQGVKAVVNGERAEFTKEYPCHSPVEKRWFQLVVAPLADKDRKGAVVLHINITQRKLAEELLLNSQANLKSVFENTDLSIILFDNDFKIAAYNNSARELSIQNFKKKLKIGSSAFNYFPAHRHLYIEQQVKKLKKGEVVSYEAQYNFEHKKEQWFDVKWVDILGKKNQMIGTILTFKDITRRKKQEQEIKRQNEALKQVAWLSSHEIRRPVASIMGLIYLTNISTDSNEKQQIFEMIEHTVNELDLIVHNIHAKINDELAGAIID